MAVCGEVLQELAVEEDQVSFGVVSALFQDSPVEVTPTFVGVAFTTVK